MKKPKDNPYIDNPDIDFEETQKLTKDKAKNQVELLRSAIEYHDYRYYVENNPLISDKIYDKLFDRLKKLENEFNLTYSNSPTQRVGGEPIDDFETVEHVVEMLSLDASEDKEDIIDFGRKVKEKIENPTYHCEPKFDGLSVEIVYRGGRFLRAVTRGDGVRGDDISKNVKTIHSVPLELRNAPGFLSLRGEIYIPKDSFQELNKKRVERGKEPFSNPRNAAAGTVRQLNPKIVARRPLNIYFYDVLDTTKDLKNHKEAMEFIEKIGFRVNNENSVVSSIEEFVEYRNKIMKKRDQLEYDIDGVVVKVNDFKKREKLGKTSRHPRWAFAYKFPAKTGETTVRDITVQVGRTGKLTPVALFDPIDINKVTISRATLHNEKQAKNLGIKVGSKIKVKRAGDVIPEVKEVTDNKEKNGFNMPENCPVCESKIIKEDEYHFCTGGVSCQAQLKRSLQHYASKQALDIDGLGKEVSSQLVEKNLVKSISDLYRLKKEDLVDLEKFADKSADKLLDQIAKSKKPDLASFLTGLGIRHVGKETARKLSEKFNLKQLKKADKENLERIPDIGPKVAESIKSFFDGKGGELVDELLKLGVEPKNKKISNELKGLKFVITGSIEDYTREDLIDLLELHGADVTSSVSSQTDYIIVGSNPGETKRKDAKENNVEELPEDKFRAKILQKIKE